jgi:tetratricopeptide (TPR) repeat protein
MRKEFYGANEFPQYHLYTLKLLAQTCLESNKVKEAIFYIEEGEEICLHNKTIGIEGRDYAQLLALKADFLYLNLKFTEAIECYEKVFETYSKIDGLKSEGCANCLKQIVKIHFQQGNYTEAILYVEECIETFLESGAQNKDFQLYDLFFIKLEILNKKTDRDHDFEEKYVDCYTKIKDLSKSLYGSKDKRTLRALTN